LPSRSIGIALHAQRDDQILGEVRHAHGLARFRRRAREQRFVAVERRVELPRGDLEPRALRGSQGRRVELLGERRREGRGLLRRQARVTADARLGELQRGEARVDGMTRGEAGLRAACVPRERLAAVLHLVGAGRQVARELVRVGCELRERRLDRIVVRGRLEPLVRETARQDLRQRAEDLVHRRARGLVWGRRVRRAHAQCERETKCREPDSCERAAHSSPPQARMDSTALG